MSVSNLLITLNNYLTMKHLVLIIIAMSLLIGPFSFGENIQDYGLKLVESLGRQIYENDITAAQATDVLFAKD